MSLFDVINVGQATTSKATLSPVEGITGIALLMVASDGYVSDEEIDLLHASLLRMKIFRGYSSDVLRRVFDKVGKELKRRAYDDYLRLMVSAVPFEMATAVFAIAVDLAFADGEVSPEEQAVLEFLYGILEIPQDTAVQIIQVMQMKNQY